MWTTVAARRALVLGRAAGPLRKTVRVLPRVLFLRNGGVAAVRPMTVSALQNAPAAAATAKKTKPKASAAKKKTTTAAKKKPTTKTKTRAKAKAKKPVKKKKKAVKKAVKKTTRARKVLTPEQRAEKKEKKEMSNLRKLALLKGPSLKAATAWTAYMSKHIQKGQGSITTQVQELASAFKDLPLGEREDLEVLAESNKAENERTVHNWVNSHPVVAIYVANSARKSIARKTGKTGARLISDRRLPTRSMNSYALFSKSNFSKADGEKNSDAFKRLAQEWRRLDPAQKEAYQKQAAAEAEKSSKAFSELREKAKIYKKEKLAAAE